MKAGVYFSTAQAPEAWAVPEYLVVRARRPSPVGFRPIKRDANGLADAVRRVIADADPAQPVAAVRSMDDILDLEVADRHQQMVLLGAFATLALVLASLGLYGLLVYGVAQPRRAIGFSIPLCVPPP